MKFRYAGTSVMGVSSEFNVHSLSELILYFEDGDATSEDFNLLEVLIEKPVDDRIDAGTWMDFKSALIARFVIPDNYNRHFREPVSVRERDRGWY